MTLHSARGDVFYVPGASGRPRDCYPRVAHRYGVSARGKTSGRQFALELGWRLIPDTSILVVRIPRSPSHPGIDIAMNGVASGVCNDGGGVGGEGGRNGAGGCASGREMISKPRLVVSRASYISYS